ncbi:MAG: hypothetical protein Q9190_001134 [Brigantiaea leucoxantha]
MAPATPSPVLQSASAPATRLRKRASAVQPLSASDRREGGKWTTSSIPDMRTQESPGWRRGNQNLGSRPSTHQGDFATEIQGTGTAKASWLRRMSTLSSSRRGSPVSTPRPGSPSVSYSNGSSAPILPDFTNPSPAMPPRNKLVKRSSSQRALGNNAVHSTLRRPATSYQRSATLQQQHQPKEGAIYVATPRSSIFFGELQEERQSFDDSVQSWQYFFKPRNIKPGKEGFSRRRIVTPTGNRSEALRTVAPEVGELPTLLLGTSIKPQPGDGSFLSSGPDALDLDSLPSMENYAEAPASRTDRVPSSRPRHSFSITDMFPSPSPSTWKMPRSGSLRRAKESQSVSSTRRIVSAPQPTRLAHQRGSSQGRATASRRSKGKSNTLGGETYRSSRSSPIDYNGRAASSPLPPLNRLSSFEIELPGAAPSYPSTPLSDAPFSTPRLSSPPSPLLSSPLGPSFNKRKSHRPSGALSDRGSTLLGSDNEISRILSSDEDDLDYRSETIYDSTRTGATGSSHSGVRKPPIQAIFDEPPPVENQKHKVTASQDAPSNDAFASIGAERDCIAEEEESVSTPVRATASSKEDDFPTPMHVSSRQSAGVSPLPRRSLVANSVDRNNHGMDDPEVDELWSFKTPERKSNDSFDIVSQDSPSRIVDSPHAIYQSVPAKLDRTEAAPRPNIFEWSERTSMERDSVQDPSPRPRTVHGKQSRDTRGSRANSRRGPSALHLRSQSVPVAPDSTGHRGNASKLESWVLGNKGVSEDWDGDFEFDETPTAVRKESVNDEPIRTSLSSGMLVPRSIMDRQASVHGQFGHVKELTLLVDELKRLRQQASGLGLIDGQSSELWKEAEGIINLATLDDEEQEFRPPRSPNSPGFDFDPFDDESPYASSRRRSSAPSPKEDEAHDSTNSLHTPPVATPEKSRHGTPPSTRPRKESTAKAKSVLETIHQQRSRNSPSLADENKAQKKLPFDTTSLRDLVVRAGVVTRALKEIIRRAENTPESPERRPSTPPNPPFSQIFQHPHPSPSPSLTKTPRVTQSPKNNNFRGGPIAGNDNEINGHMKIMTVV